MLFSFDTSMKQQDPSLGHGIWSGLMQESRITNLEEQSDGMLSEVPECAATYWDPKTLPLYSSEVKS